MVHLIGLERGLTPIAHAHTSAALAEERRLLHVAVTRAERELHVYWCTSRLLGGAVTDRDPSPWLELIGPPEVDPDLPDPETGVAAARTQLAEIPVPRNEHAPLRLALEDWRSRVARQARIEPAAVVSDLVLDELVAQRPVDLTDLAQVDGLAPGHARRWGEDLVAIVGAHATS